MPREVARQRDVLNRLFAKIAALGTDDLELRSHWARYLCVLLEGHIEVSIQAILEQYVARTTNVAPLIKFAQSSLRRLQNLNMERIIQVAGRFNPDWAENLRIATEGNLKEAIDSVVALRNQIAHGKSVDVTFTRVQDYYERVSKVIDLVDQQAAN